LKYTLPDMLEAFIERSCSHPFSIVIRRTSVQANTISNPNSIVLSLLYHDGVPCRFVGINFKMYPKYVVVWAKANYTLLSWSHLKWKRKRIMKVPWSTIFRFLQMMLRV
jgi:hypothetical protein